MRAPIRSASRRRISIRPDGTAFRADRITINPGAEHERATLLARAKKTLDLQNAHESQDGGISVPAFERFDYLRNRRRTAGPNDFHDAMLSIGKAIRAFARHTVNEQLRI
jgi:hypothetical protein